MFTVGGALVGGPPVLSAEPPFRPLSIGSFDILSRGRVDYRTGEISYLFSIEILFSLGLLWGSRVRREAR